MKLLKFVISCLIIGLLASCISLPPAEPTPTISLPYRIIAEENPYAARTGDLGMKVGGVDITSIHLSERLDLDPPRVNVGILGSMPGTCNELRVTVEPPDEEFRIFIEVYSLIPPNASCDRVFQQFEANILLGVYSQGRYTVWVNGSPVGDFVAP